MMRSSSYVAAFPPAVPPLRGPKPLDLLGKAVAFPAFRAVPAFAFRVVYVEGFSPHDAAALVVEVLRIRGEQWERQLEAAETSRFLGVPPPGVEGGNEAGNAGADVKEAHRRLRRQSPSPAGQKGCWADLVIAHNRVGIQKAQSVQRLRHSQLNLGRQFRRSEGAT